MKPTVLSTALLTIASLASFGSLQASTVVSGNPSPGSGIPYKLLLTLAGNDAAFLSGKVGAWSWADDDLTASSGTEGSVGWTHQSNWFALTLSEPVRLTLSLSSKGDVPAPIAGDPTALAGGNLVPGLTLWSRWDGDATPVGQESKTHVYNNHSNVLFAEDLQYYTHLTAAGGGNQIQGTWELPAGNYTLVLGGNAVSTEFEPDQGYGLTVTTAAVPEPGSALLVLLGAAVLGSTRRRLNH